MACASSGVTANDAELITAGTSMDVLAVSSGDPDERVRVGVKLGSWRQPVFAESRLQSDVLQSWCRHR